MPSRGSWQQASYGLVGHYRSSTGSSVSNDGSRSSGSTFSTSSSSRRKRWSSFHGSTGPAQAWAKCVCLLACTAALLALAAFMYQPCTQQQGDASQAGKATQQLGPQFVPHHITAPGDACERRNGTLGLHLPITRDLVAPLVIVAHSRVHYLAKCISTLLRYWDADAPNARRFSLYVSVDGGVHATVQFAGAFNFAAGLQVIVNSRDPARCNATEAYCNIAAHYQALLELFFVCHNAPRLLFLEEDLQIAPDFFSYFAATAPLLDSDPGLMCVSAWNDMLTGPVGRELLPNWPRQLWDEMLRMPQVRAGRQCVFPEVPRTHTYGKVGASRGEGYKRYLETMPLDSAVIEWDAQEIPASLETSAYAQQMSAWLAAAQPLPLQHLWRTCYEGRFGRRQQQQQQQQQQHDVQQQGDLVVYYQDERSFRRIARDLKIMPDFKGQQGLNDTGHPQQLAPVVPRASYNGIVTVRCQAGVRLFIAPEPGSLADPTSAHWRHGGGGLNSSNSSSSSSSSSSSNKRTGSVLDPNSDPDPDSANTAGGSVQAVPGVRTEEAQAAAADVFAKTEGGAGATVHGGERSSRRESDVTPGSERGKLQPVAVLGWSRGAAPHMTAAAAAPMEAEGVGGVSWWRRRGVQPERRSRHQQGSSSSSGSGPGEFDVRMH